MRYLILLSVFIILSSCTKHYSLTLETPNAEGLTTRTPIYLKGVIIGRVDNIKFSPENKVQLGIKLDHQLNIPNDSKFHLITEDMLGSRAINIQLGTSTKNYTPSDIISLLDSAYLQTPNSAPLSKMIQSGIDVLTKQDKFDSILIELQRLNKLLEKHVNEHN